LSIAEASALLLDLDGNVTETGAANILIVERRNHRLADHA